MPTDYCIKLGCKRLLFCGVRPNLWNLPLSLSCCAARCALQIPCVVRPLRVRLQALLSCAVRPIVRRAILLLLHPHACMSAKLLQSCPTLCNPTDCSPPGSSAHGDSPDKNTGKGYHAFLQSIFPTQASNWSLLQLLHCR